MTEIPAETDVALPMAARRTADLPGHWLLARLGKRVLRPGGKELTSLMLADASPAGADVVELAPGLGKTATSILSFRPASYVGVESDDDAANLTRNTIGDGGHVVVADASQTGLAEASADVVVGEAMLTMQSDAHKAQIVREAWRVLRAGGRYAVHELALMPDSVDDSVKSAIRKALARSIKVNARPLTAAEWSALLAEAGFEVDVVRTAPMALLRPRRVIADEGVLRTLRFVANVARDSAARKRVIGMRRTFREHRDNLAAIAVIARKPDRASGQ